MTHNETLAYCAGIVDGEGSISIKKYMSHRLATNGKPYDYWRYDLSIQVNQVRPEAVRILYATFGGRLTFQQRTPNSLKKADGTAYSGRWVWIIDGRKVGDCLRALYDFLAIKREEAAVAIQFLGFKMKSESGRSFKLGLTPDEVAQREKLYQELHNLKHTHDNPFMQDHYTTLSQTAK